MLTKILLVSAAVFATSQAKYEEHTRIINDMNSYNILANCWGQANLLKRSIAQRAAIKVCNQMEPAGFVPDNLFEEHKEEDVASRRRRQLSEDPESEKAMLLERYEDFKGAMTSKMGNLTCVLKQLQMLDEEGNVNMGFYLNGVWEYYEQTNAGSDPEFVAKMKEELDTCNQISQSWPEKSFEKNPMKKAFGRQMVFLKCARKTEFKGCYMYQAKQWMELMIGEIEPRDGVDEDAYDHAAMALKVVYGTQSPEEKFVYNFLWENEL